MAVLQVPFLLAVKELGINIHTDLKKYLRMQLPF